MSTGQCMRAEASEIMGRWRPGSYDPPWTWDDEAADLDSRGELADLTESVREHGVREPVLLAGDGRVWDGHHRVIAAYRAQRPVPYTIVAADNTGTA